MLYFGSECIVLAVGVANGVFDVVTSLGQYSPYEDSPRAEELAGFRQRVSMQVRQSEQVGPRLGPYARAFELVFEIAHEFQGSSCSGPSFKSSTRARANRIKDFPDRSVAGPAWPTCSRHECCRPQSPRKSFDQLIPHVPYFCISMKCGELQLTSQLVVRASPELIDLVRKVAEARGEYVADLVRRAVKTELARLSFLSDFEKKALGVERVVRREATHRIQEARE